MACRSYIYLGKENVVHAKKEDEEKNKGEAWWKHVKRKIKVRHDESMCVATDQSRTEYFRIFSIASIWENCHEKRFW
jgi:hypothetical protein